MQFQAKCHFSLTLWECQSVGCTPSLCDREAGSRAGFLYRSAAGQRPLQSSGEGCRCARCSMLAALGHRCLRQVGGPRNLGESQQHLPRFLCQYPQARGRLFFPRSPSELLLPSTPTGLAHIAPLPYCAIFPGTMCACPLCSVLLAARPRTECCAGTWR